MENSQINQDISLEQPDTSVQSDTNSKALPTTLAEDEVMKPINRYFTKDYDEVVDWFENDYQNFSI